MCEFVLMLYSPFADAFVKALRGGVSLLTAMYFCLQMQFCGLGCDCKLHKDQDCFVSLRMQIR